MTALATDALTVRFGSFTAVADVTLAIMPGERHALIGPNGAGKTTLVHALTGALRPAAGRVLLENAEITGLREHERVRRGLSRTFQISQLFAALTVRENVMLVLLERERRSSNFWGGAMRDSALLDEAQSHLTLVGLQSEAGRIVRELPYGAQRLLEIALALATRPRVLLLDEPAAGVPAAQSEAVFERIRDLPRDLTLLFVEHDMNLVFRFAERITVMAGGRVLTEGTPAEISADARVREVYLGRRGHHAAA